MHIKPNNEYPKLSHSEIQKLVNQITGIGKPRYSPTAAILTDSLFWTILGNQRENVTKYSEQPLEKVSTETAKRRLDRLIKCAEELKTRLVD